MALMVPARCDARVDRLRTGVLGDWPGAPAWAGMPFARAAAPAGSRPTGGTGIGEGRHAGTPRPVAQWDGRRVVTDRRPGRPGGTARRRPPIPGGVSGGTLAPPSTKG